RHRARAGAQRPPAAAPPTRRAGHAGAASRRCAGHPRGRVMTVAALDLNRAALRRDERRERVRLTLLAVPAVIVILLVIVAPLVWMLSISLKGPDGTLSFHNYRLLIEEGTNIAIIGTTLKIAFLVTLFATAIGYPIAYLMVQLSPGWTRAIVIVIMMPYMTS